VIPPEVLASDQQKYEASGGDSKYVDRAYRRGKLGDLLAPSDATRGDVRLAGGVRFGSPDSVDTDLLYPVQRLPSLVDAKSLCSGGPANRNLIVIRATRLILSLVSRSIYRDRVKEALRVLNHGLRMEVLAQIDFQQLDLPADAAKQPATRCREPPC
jgi:hypothetical protein